MARIGLWKMLATLAAFGLALTLTGCGDNGNGGGGSGHLGDTLNFSGRVYTMDGETFRFSPFTGSRTITSYPAGGTGAIANGQLTFEMGRPDTEDLRRLDGTWWLFEDATINPSSARGTYLNMRTPGGIFRENNNFSISGNTMSGTWDAVEYVFVDQEVTISRGRQTWEEEGLSIIDNAFNITLREGWNAVHSRFVSRNLNWETDTGSITETISLGNPGNLRWVLYESDGYSENLEPAQGRTGTFPSPRARR